MLDSPFIHTFKTPLGFYVFDVNTNQIIGVSSKLYDYLEDDSNLTEEVVREIELLKKRGYFSSKRPKRLEHPQTPFLKYHLDENIEQMTLQLTQQCNFRCDYCTYAPKDFEYQRSHSAKKMSLELALRAVDFLVRHSRNQQEVCIGFYGGEPLLQFNLIREIVAYAENAFEGKTLKYTITTNGSLFTTEIAAFFKKHNIDVMVSLDGTPEIHDRSRRFAATGKGTYSTIEKNLIDIKKNDPEFYKNIHFNVVVDPRFSCNELHAMYSENETFRDADVRSTLVDAFYGVEHIVENEIYRIENRQHLFKAYLAEIGRYPEEKVSRVSLKSLRDAKGKREQEFFYQDELPDVTSHSGPCIPGQRRVLVDVEGKLFPCERVSETSDVMCIGSIQDGFDYEKADALLNICRLTEEQCKNCWALAHCGVCARVCDNNGELSPGLKLSNCKRKKYEAEASLKTHIFYREFAVKEDD